MGYLFKVLYVISMGFLCHKNGRGILRPRRCGRESQVAVSCCLKSLKYLRRMELLAKGLR